MSNLKWKAVEDLVPDGEQLRQLATAPQMEGAKILLDTIAAGQRVDEDIRDNHPTMNDLDIRKHLFFVLGRIDKAQEILGYPTEAQQFIEKADKTEG